MTEIKKDYQRVFVLGAGFSKPARLPLCADLFKEIKEEAKKRDLYAELEEDINSFIEYQYKAKGKKITPDEINIEDFISYLDIEHFLCLKGYDSYSDEGYPSQLIVKNLIAQILYSKESAMQDEDFALYESFAERLKPGDTIITFNYDTILENTFSRKNIPYRLFPNRYKEVHPYGGILADTNDEIILLKMHGSIDWFDISAYDRELNLFRDEKFYVPPSSHNIFNRNGKPFGLYKIIDEPYFAESPLQKIYRNFDLEDYLAENSYQNPPLIISPSHSKMVYLNPLTEFWESYNKAGRASGTVTIIGFSLPEHDEYIRQPLYHLVNNFQNNDYGKGSLEKTNLKMIDFKQNPSEIEQHKEKYGFVDWDRTDCYFKGFNEESLEVIFGK